MTCCLLLAADGGDSNDGDGLCAVAGMPQLGWADKRNEFHGKIESRRAGMGDINTAGRVVRGKRKAELMNQ